MPYQPAQENATPTVRPAGLDENSLDTGRADNNVSRSTAITQYGIACRPFGKRALSLFSSPITAFHIFGNVLLVETTTGLTYFNEAETLALLG